jgi:magnesium-transporting ATPase (P-type)
MITGDSKGTAISVAKETGILNSDDRMEDCVFTGTEFDLMNNEQKRKAVGG